jgi:hypothetical protein
MVAFTLRPHYLRGKAPGTHWIGGGWAPEPVRTMWRRENSWPYRDSNSDPSVVQPIASCYINYAIQVGLKLNGTYQLLSLSLTLRPTVSRPVCLGIKHPSGAYDQIFITCVTVTVLFLWGAFSDERSGLSFVCCWPLPAQSFSGPSPLGLQTIFYCLRFETSISSPPMTRRVTVEVFDPASTRVYSCWSMLMMWIHWVIT